MTDSDHPLVFARHLPAPHRADRRRRRRQIARAAGRHFASVAVHRLLRRPLPEPAFARPLRLTFTELGGTFVKFGQLLGSAPGIFGDAVADEFRGCLDTGPPVPFDAVRRVVENDLGRPLEEAFATFEEAPVGEASLAVVHKATLHDGREVAVKVLRPGIDRLVATDIDLLQPTVEWVVRVTGEELAAQLLQLIEGFKEQIAEELDLRNEGRAQAHYLALLEEVDLPLVTVPEPYFEFSGPNVLTMEFLDGVPVDDLAGIAEMGYNPRPVIEQVVRGWLLTAVRWRSFHGDVHAGNLMMLPDGRIGVLDWGIVGRLDDDSHWFFRRVLAAGLGDESAWEDVAAYLERTYSPAMREAMGLDQEGFSAFVRGVLEPILTRPFGEVSLAELFTAAGQQVAMSQGTAGSGRSLSGTLQRWKTNRRLHAEAAEAGGSTTMFDRHTLLLSKQLIYFERYGKMYLSDVSLMEDREFIEKLLAE